jgi:hypothetical protein
VKNHLIVLSPDCLETCVSVEMLESLFHVGRHSPISLQLGTCVNHTCSIKSLNL